MDQSQQVLEWQAAAEKQGRVAAKVDVILRVLAVRFAKAIPAELGASIRNITDLAILEERLDQALVAKSLTEFQELADDSITSVPLIRFAHEPPTPGSCPPPARPRP